MKEEVITSGDCGYLKIPCCLLIFEGDGLVGSVSFSMLVL